MEGTLSGQLYHMLHAYVAWWVLLAVFLALLALFWKYEMRHWAEDDEETKRNGYRDENW
jgi:hypothetical protein